MKKKKLKPNVEKHNIVKKAKGPKVHVYLGDVKIGTCEPVTIETVELNQN